MHAHLVDILRVEVGMSVDQAAEMAPLIYLGMCKRFGGQTLGRRGTIYVPTPSKALRNDAIRAEFNGRNMTEIQKKYGLGKTRIYEVVRDSNKRKSP